MKERFGGGDQEGIILSKTTPNILIYTDHESGREYGYEDGWLEEEDEHGPVFEYTGKGRTGHQTFEGSSGSRNNAILHHVDDGKTLRLFMAAGKSPDLNPPQSFNDILANLSWILNNLIRSARLTTQKEIGA